MSKDRLRLELPTIERKDDAIDYIREFIAEGTFPCGTNGLYSAICKSESQESYKSWLEHCESCRITQSPVDALPERTYFVVREKDYRIVGMISIHMSLNDERWNNGGNIGYSIRESERGKGYAKTALYLALLRCLAYNLEAILVDCERNNTPSMRTILAVGGKKIREYWSEKYQAWNNVYVIDVYRSINEYYCDYKDKIIG